MKELKVLGLGNNASLDDVKSAYRKLAKMYHPDVNPGGQKIFIEITNAYEYLLKNIGKVKYSKPEPKQERHPDPAPPPQPAQNWKPDPRYQFFDEKKRRWITNKYYTATFISREPDRNGYYLLRMPKACFDYDGVLLHGNNRFFFKKNQADGSIIEIGDTKLKIVYTEDPRFY